MDLHALQEVLTVLAGDLVPVLVQGVDPQRDDG